MIETLTESGLRLPLAGSVFSSAFGFVLVSESHENAMSTVFPTPHDRILRDGYAFGAPAVPVTRSATTAALNEALR